MLELIEAIIDGKDYSLTHILEVIEREWTLEHITADQRDYLISKARTNADPSGELGSLEARVIELEKIVMDLQKVVEELTTNPDDPTVPTDIPEWKQPIGTIGLYNPPTRVKFNDKVYECIMPNNSFSPEAYPDGWKLIEEETATLEEPVVE